MNKIDSTIPINLLDELWILIDHCIIGYVRTAILVVNMFPFPVNIVV